MQRAFANFVYFARLANPLLHLLVYLCCLYGQCIVERVIFESLLRFYVLNTIQILFTYSKSPFLSLAYPLNTVSILFLISFSNCAFKTGKLSSVS